MLIVLTGKSNSGKDTIAKELQNRGINRILSYTTRPMREGEQDGVEYNFTSDELMFNNIDLFILLKQYKVASGQIWNYAFKESDFNNIRNDRYFVIADPFGATELKNMFPYDVFIIQLIVGEYTRFSRAIKRGDNIDEVLRRLEADEQDFKDFKADLMLTNENENQKENNIKFIEKLFIEE